MDDAVIKRIPPHNDEAERAVIGSMMMDRDAIQLASEQVVPEDFYNRQFGVLFSALVDMNKKGQDVDLVTIQNKLREMDIPPELTSVEFISGLLAGVPTSANVRHYARIVSEKALLRRLIKVTENITAKCYLDKQPLDDLLEQTQKDVFDVVQKGDSGDFEDIRQVILRTLESIEAAARQEGHITGLSTGFRDLDYKTAGLQKSDLILIAGRPAMGKTAFALTMAVKIALHTDKTIAIFSLEMSKEQLVKRMLSMNSSIDAQKLRSGDLEDEDWGPLVDSVRRLGNSHLVIDDRSGTTVNDIMTKCRKLKLEKGLDLIIIDYLQLMTGGKGRRSENRQNEISEISRSLKVMARELNVPVIALSQLSRAVEQRPDKRPMLSDLRESGAIEQDADMVMFLYREEYYKPDTEKKGQAELIIAKQRSGPTGTVPLAWIAKFSKYENLEYENG